MTEADFNVTMPCMGPDTARIEPSGLVEGIFSVEAGRRNALVLQAAIDEASSRQGGTVVVPQGFFACAPLVLKSCTALELEKGSVLKFIKSREDYPLVVTGYEGLTAIRTVSPISADGAHDIAITGSGIIDGSGDLWRPVKKFKLTDRQWDELLARGGVVFEGKETVWFPTGSAFEGMQNNIQDTSCEGLEAASEYWDFYRPVMVSLQHCERVLLEGVTFRNSPSWNIHPLFCTDLTVRSIKVSNAYYAQNGDGIDIESCNRVHVHDCTFETGDDAICLKSGKNAAARAVPGPCENVFIHDCTVYEGHGGFVIGSEMSRGVRNVLVKDCTFIGTDVGVRFKSCLGRGGVVRNIEIDNISMVNIKNQAIILTMGYVLNFINKEEAPVMAAEDDIPYFRDIRMTGMKFLGQRTRLLIEPVPGREDTITGVSVNGVTYSGSTRLE